MYIYPVKSQVLEIKYQRNMQILRATIFILHFGSHRMKFVEENKNKTEIKNSFSYAFPCTNNCINYFQVTELYSLIMEKYSEKIWMIICFWHNLIREVTFTFINI